jgi:pyruvate/2-oxoglutarate dehydrogenase complex dihydrolipoamide acyltransferase (E2) component
MCVFNFRQAQDRVVTDQPLVSVETDKAAVEVPSP